MFVSFLISVDVEEYVISLEPSIGTCRRAGTSIAMKRELGLPFLNFLQQKVNAIA